MAALTRALTWGDYLVGNLSTVPGVGAPAMAGLPAAGAGGAAIVDDSANDAPPAFQVGGVKRPLGGAAFTSKAKLPRGQ